YLPDELIKATAEHPFYHAQKGWTHAKDLRAGDAVRTAKGAHQNVTKAAYENDNGSAGNEADDNGQATAPAASATVTNDNTSFAFDGDQGNNSGTVIIEQIKQLAGQFRVFNFGVDTYHTYFIGDGAYVLVHNPVGELWDVSRFADFDYPRGHATGFPAGADPRHVTMLTPHHIVADAVYKKMSVDPGSAISVVIPEALHVHTLNFGGRSAERGIEYGIWKKLKTHDWRGRAGFAGALGRGLDGLMAAELAYNAAAAEVRFPELHIPQRVYDDVINLAESGGEINLDEAKFLRSHFVGAGGAAPAGGGGGAAAGAGDGIHLRSGKCLPCS
ncbi:MAG: hypothetical protein J0G29_07760, partial [Alphaproteobacteria bacterium]|nr:hypothetical protein [Alphaproteobacteria bacterium]